MSASQPHPIPLRTPSLETTGRSVLPTEAGGGSEGVSASCVDFVNELTRLAESAKQAATVGEARRQLAVEIVYRFVPRTSILGIRVRRGIAGSDPVANRRDPSEVEWRTDGFRPSLIRGGQNEEVVRHVAAAAACVLRRRTYLVRIASLYDWMQGWFRNRAEAKAEVAGNNAGLQVGRALAEYVEGRLDGSRLRTVLAAILCK